jgi:hypothetical protein
MLYGAGAWGILGDKGAGKSSTLGFAAMEGLDVLTDDLLIVDGNQAFAGPRCVDLRLEAAQALRVGTDLGVVGLRERWRVYPKEVPATAELAGWILLSWGENDIRSVPPAERLKVLLAGRALALPEARPADLLDLIDRPMVVWRRPQGWKSARRAIDPLLRALEAGV